MYSDIYGLLDVATADGNGDWFVVCPTLSEDTHTLTATATDAAGNVSGDGGPQTLVIDVTAPDAPTIAATASPTNNQTPTITGTAEAGARVELYSDVDGLVGEVTADGNGDWSIICSTLSEDTHTLTATATDAAGNVSDAGGPQTLVIDVTQPEVLGSPVINAGATQRDYLSEIVFAFNEDVTITADALKVYFYDTDPSAWTGPLSMPDLQFEYISATHEARWWMDPAIIDADGSTKGDYVYQLDFASVEDAAGNALEDDVDDDAVVDFWRFHLLDGDINGNREQDVNDIDLLFEFIANSDDGYDINGDGVINAADMDELILNILGTYYGDMDLDGIVDIPDFVLLKNNFGVEGEGWASGDIDGDGIVDITDFVILKNNFGLGDPIGYELGMLGEIPTWP